MNILWKMPYLSHLCIPNWLQSRTKILSNSTEGLRGLRETKYYFHGQKKGLYTHVLYTTPKFPKWFSRRDLAPLIGRLGHAYYVPRLNILLPVASYSRRVLDLKVPIIEFDATSLCTLPCCRSLALPCLSSQSYINFRKVVSLIGHCRLTDVHWL